MAKNDGEYIEFAIELNNNIDITKQGRSFWNGKCIRGKKH